MTKRILVVEDQEDNRRIIRDLHAERSYRTVYVGPEHPGYAGFPLPGIGLSRCQSIVYRVINLL